MKIIACRENTAGCSQCSNPEERRDAVIIVTLDDKTGVFWCYSCLITKIGERGDALCMALMVPEHRMR